MLRVGCNIAGREEQVWKEAPAFLRGGKNSVELVLFCLQDMVWDLQYKTVRWSFVESLEPAQVVQVRCSSMLNQGNVYGQVTVRMHTRQVRTSLLPQLLVFTQVGHRPLELRPQLPRTVGSKGRFTVVFLALSLCPSYC